jgi:hypothetical protein
VLPIGDSDHLKEAWLLPLGDSDRLNEAWLLPLGDSDRLNEAWLLPIGDSDRLNEAGLLPLGDSDRLNEAWLLPIGDSNRLNEAGLLPGVSSKSGKTALYPCVETKGDDCSGSSPGSPGTVMKRGMAASNCNCNCYLCCGIHHYLSHSSQLCFLHRRIYLTFQLSQIWYAGHSFWTVNPVLFLVFICVFGLFSLFG